MDPDSHSSGYYTSSEAARILRRSDRWVRRELAAGRLQGEQTETGRWRIPARTVEERRKRDRRLSLANDSPQTFQDLTDQLIELSIELGRTQALLHMAEERADRLEQELQAERSKGH